jgi:hypothetical protein
MIVTKAVDLDLAGSHSFNRIPPYRIKALGTK